MQHGGHGGRRVNQAGREFPREDTKNSRRRLTGPRAGTTIRRGVGDLANYHSQQEHALHGLDLRQAHIIDLSVEDAVKSIVLLAFLILLDVSVAGAQVYTVTDLGPMAPTAINNLGQVVGNRNGSAFLWSKGQAARNLGTLFEGTSTYAASINDLGVVTGTAVGPGLVISPDSSIPNEACSDLTQPFVWTQTNGVQGLGTVGVPPYEIMSPYWCEIQFYGTGINAFGQVVGYTTEYEDNYQWAFSWTSTAGMTLFGSSFPPSVANAVSDGGEAVGQTGVLLGQANSWRDGVDTVLGTFGDLDYSSSANAINDVGQAAGWSTTIALNDCDWNLATCPMRAVLWTPTGEISDLGTLPGDTLSAASGINVAGQVIGASGKTLVGQGWGGNGGSGFGGDGGSVAVIGRPFIWSASTGMQDLNTLIGAGSGWVLNSVSGINASGQIVGSGTWKGQSHGFLLTP